MPTRTPTIIQPDLDRLPGGWSVITWSGLLNTDDGAPVDMVAYPDRSVQIDGTPGVGGTIVIQGRNSSSGGWTTLKNPQGAALSFTAAGLEAVQGLTRQVRPLVTAGDGATNFTVTMLVRGGLR